LTHVGPIGVRGLAGEVPGDGRWRCLRCGSESDEMWGGARPCVVWELEWRLGRSFELLVGHEHERRR
jgi:hypothetical protein